jgi:hypothetical protein
MTMLRTLIAISMIALTTGVAYAQFGIPSIGNDISIVMNPSAPAPHQSVTLTAQSSALDLSSAAITWSLDSKTIAQGVGQTQVQLTSPELGSSMHVHVSAKLSSGSAATDLTLTSGSVDLLVDADSFVPPFYRGRALGSPGTTLRLQAIPHLVSPAGTTLAASELIYTWKQDGTVLGSISGLGKSSARMPAPPLYGASQISVDVRSASGSYGASASVRMPSIDPSLTLYVDHPLFGMEYFSALADRSSGADIETTFAAVPYFVPFASAADSRLTYAWTINGKLLAASSTASNELTVSAKGVSGPATLSLSLNSPADYYLDAHHSWNVTFQGASAFSPSPSPSSGDAFHSSH